MCNCIQPRFTVSFDSILLLLILFSCFHYYFYVFLCSAFLSFILANVAAVAVYLFCALLYYRFSELSLSIHYRVGLDEKFHLIRNDVTLKMYKFCHSPYMSSIINVFLFFEVNLFIFYTILIVIFVKKE